ncbi:MAG TPA: hypothetical protein VFT42_05095 [Solirubrobacteraceae bacterium]|nr:hypothetical protein [Solirubrobacteraceae bacterium]
MNANALRWDGAPGHYEVHYLSATDRGSGTGLWIRYTMLAPLQGEATCALWFMAMGAGGERFARKLTLPIAELTAEPEPFHLRIGDSELTDRGMAGGFEDVRWELRWEPRLPAAEHVHTLLRRAKIAKTVLTLPHPALAVEGTLSFGGRAIELSGAHGGQAHLWGSKHASRWAWLHCDDLESLEGEPQADSFVDGVSVFVPRFGREIGPSTPVVARLLGEDFRATSPLRVTRNPSRFALTTWRFEALDGTRKVVGEVDAPRDSLVGVTYTDPDGEKAWCYNSEVASLRLFVWDRTARGRFGWTLRDTLVGPGRAHFEYAQREPVADVPVLVA